MEGQRFPYSIHSGNPGAAGLLPTELSRMAALKKLIGAVRAYQPDVIYLRWAMYVYPLQRLLNLAPAVVEINTNDVEEHKLLGGVMSTYNLLTRGITLGGASGIVYATQELSEMEEFQRFHKPGLVVSNSIELSAVTPMPAPHNKRPHLAFIGTPGFAWHGVEKLVFLAKTCPDILIDVIGYDHIEGVPDLPDNLILHGYQDGRGLRPHPGASRRGHWHAGAAPCRAERSFAPQSARLRQPRHSLHPAFPRYRPG